MQEHENSLQIKSKMRLKSVFLRGLMQCLIGGCIFIATIGAAIKLSPLLFFLSFLLGFFLIGAFFSFFLLLKMIPVILFFVIGWMISQIIRLLGKK